MAEIHGRARVDQALARSRVPLGFVFGAVVVWLAQPTFATLAAGGAIATLGELLRVWAAGHLEKGREVTQSGPYRLIRHPLYTGSAVIGAGVAVASARWSAAALVALYLLPTIVAAISDGGGDMGGGCGEGIRRVFALRGQPGGDA